MSPSTSQLIVLLVLVGLAPGCTTLQMSPDYAGPKPLGAELAALFKTPPPTGEMLRKSVLEKTRHYQIDRFEISSTLNLLDKHPILVDLYRPLTEGPHPLILTLPILGGKNRVANHFAAVFARAGFAAAVVHRQEQYKNTSDLETLNKVFRQIVLDHRQALDHLTRLKSIDVHRVGLFGISYGAIRGTLIAAIDLRIKASVLGLGGGDFAHILAHSSERGLVKRRQKIAAEHKATPKEVSDAIRAGFKHDPLVYAPYIDARRTLLILGAFDTVVPYEACGLKLRKAMGEPRTIVLPTGHYTAILFLPFLEVEAVAFFKQHGVSPGRPTADAQNGASR